jgi:MATE family multidrug resistance protein
MKPNFQTNENLNKPPAIGEEASLKYMLKLAGPMIITTISFTIMQFVDRLMVSRLGTVALAAIVPAGLVSFLPASFLIGAMTSVTTFVSQSLGRGEKRDCSNYCWQGIYLGLVFFGVIVAVMWPSAPFIFRFLGHEPQVAAQEVIYLRIMLYAQVIAVFIWSCTQFFMGIHRPIITMYAALCAQVVNITFNYLLIFGKFGFPKMGIAGAGWGTFMGIVVGAVIRMAVYLGKNLNAEFLSRQTMHPDIRKMVDLIKVGAAAGFELMINVALWGVILTFLIAPLGRKAMAATSAVLAWTNVSLMPLVGMERSLTAAIGKSIGADRKDVAIKQTNICFKVALGYSVIMGICFVAFRRTLMGLWSGDEMVVRLGIWILLCAAVYQIFQAARMVYSGSLKGAGDTVWLAAVSAAGAGVILGLGGAASVYFFSSAGAIGPWIAGTCSILAVGLANRWRFKSNNWMKIDLFKHRRAAVPVEIETVAD